MNNLDLINTLRGKQVQDRNYSSIQAVPVWGQIEVAIETVTGTVAALIKGSSPETTTVVVGMHTRKDVEYLSFRAGQGSPDGFPSVVVRA